jgi:hypothetical protein
MHLIVRFGQGSNLAALNSTTAAPPNFTKFLRLTISSSLASASPVRWLAAPASNAKSSHAKMASTRIPINKVKILKLSTASGKIFESRG